MTSNNLASSHFFESASYSNNIVNSKGVSGTLGCKAYIKNGSVPVFLSNWHVLFGKGAVKRDAIYLNSGAQKQQKLEKLGQLHSGSIGNMWFHNWEFFIDCAIATFTNPDIWTYLPDINGHTQVALGDEVHKLGAASGHTRGTVIALQHEARTHVAGRTVCAKNQLLIRSDNGGIFSRIGDSGAAILNKDNAIVGLLWGTTATGDGIACPILPVVHQFDLEFKKIEIIKKVKKSNCYA